MFPVLQSRKPFQRTNNDSTMTNAALKRVELGYDHLVQIYFAGPYREYTDQHGLV